MQDTPEPSTAYELTLEAVSHMSNMDRDSYETARNCLRKAMAQDPELAMPVAYLVRWYCIYIGQGWSSNYARDVADAKQYATRAIRLDRYNSLALASYGHLKSFLEHDYDTALLFLERARDVAPSHGLAWMLSSLTLSYLGRADEALEHAEQGIALSPGDPNLFQFYDILSIAHYTKRDFQAAAQWSERSYGECAVYVPNWRAMTVTNAAAGHLELAREFAAKILARTPDFTVASYMDKLCPYRRASDRRIMEAHLTLAGVPTG